MMTDTDSHISRIFGFIDRVIHMEKKSRLRVGDATFHPSEVHLVLFLHQEQAWNVTQIAERLGVTKGAVSQTLGRLEKKGVLRRTKIPAKKNELLVEFLPFGFTVVEECQRLRERMKQKFSAHISDLSEEDRQIATLLIERLGDAIEEEAGHMS